MVKRAIFFLLAASSCFGQTVPRGSTNEPPQILWPKSAVTVVFAPDLPQAAHREKSADTGTLESWMRNPTLAVLSSSTGKPVEFVTPNGAIGIRAGLDSAVGTVITIGDDGKRHVECALLREALAKLNPALSQAHSPRVGNDR